MSFLLSFTVLTFAASVEESCLGADDSVLARDGGAVVVGVTPCSGGDGDASVTLPSAAKQNDRKETVNMWGVVPPGEGGGGNEGCGGEKERSDS